MTVTVVGVDACKRGWIAVVLRPGALPEAHYLPAIEELSSTVPGAQVVAVDIPIGLPETGRRDADVEARKVLGARRDSVFFAPVRDALLAATHALASEASKRLTGLGISQQSFALGPKVREVEEWIPDAPCPVFEIHPELSFAQLMQRPATASKKSWAGMVERRAALAGVGIVLDSVSGAAAVNAAADDVLDAAVAAWTAGRLLDGTAVSFPVSPPVDRRGRHVAIWA